MKLKVILPDKILFLKEVTKISADGINGNFCLLPRHIDFVSVLKSSILIYTLPSGKEEYLAHTEAILVKCKEVVSVTTKHAVAVATLGQFENVLKEKFKTLLEEEKKTQTYLIKMESDFVKRFLELKK